MEVKLRFQDPENCPVPLNRGNRYKHYENIFPLPSFASLDYRCTKGEFQLHRVVFYLRVCAAICVMTGLQLSMPLSLCISTCKISILMFIHFLEELVERI